MPQQYNERLPFNWKYMPLAVGTRLGSYDIVALIGAGGMASSIGRATRSDVRWLAMMLDA